MEFLAALGKVLLASQEKMILPLYLVLVWLHLEYCAWLVLHSSVRERHGHTEKSPTESNLGGPPRWRRFPLSIRKHFSAVRVTALAQVAQRGCRVSLFGGLHIWTAGHPALGVPAGVWNPCPPEVPSNLSLSGILKILTWKSFLCYAGWESKIWVYTIPNADTNTAAAVMVLSPACKV